MRRRDFIPLIGSMAAWSLAALAQQSELPLIDSFFFAHIEKLAALASRNKLPAIFGFREYPKAGGLMSYGADLNDQHRTVGAYVGRILNGEKPGDLPVQQSVHVQLVVNLKAAKLLGLTMPSSLLLRADEIIE